MILYFSATGNSRHLALKLAEDLEEKDIVDMGGMIKKGKTGSFASSNPYIFVLPTYGWRMPRIVSDFIENSQFDGNKRAYFVLTCGDSSGNAGKYAKSLCLTKNLEFMGCTGIKMPENYVAMFSVPDERTSETLIKSGEKEIKRLGQLIKEGNPIPTDHSFIGALESGIVNSAFYTFCVKAKGFRSTEQCIGCGLCVQYCVLNNIKLKDGHPVWGNNCTHCMACICRCPKEAIEYKNKSQGKRRYYLEEE